MPFDQTLLGEMIFDLLSQGQDIGVLLRDMWRKHDYAPRDDETTTYSEPFRSLCTKAEAFKLEADTGLATVVSIRTLVAFLD